MESRSKSCRARQFIGPVPLIAGLVILLAFGPGCGGRPDSVTRQFYERLVALDITGMSEFVCEADRPAFRHAVEFIEFHPERRQLRLENFRVRTDRSDGTSATMRVTGRIVDDERREVGLSDQVRLVRDGSQWCISGQRDGFLTIRESAQDVFFLMSRSGSSVDP